MDELMKEMCGYPVVPLVNKGGFVSPTWILTLEALFINMYERQKIGFGAVGDENNG